MSKNPECWANVLGDCRGPLTGEHLISVAVWSVPTGQRANRNNKMRRQVRVVGDPRVPSGQARTTTVRNLTADILCEHHNNSTNPLDEEGGRFARAIEQWFATRRERSWAPNLNWSRQTYSVDGRLLERWFLKTAINNAFSNRNLPIGSPDAHAGWPSRELVEMVFGLRRVNPPAGLFALSAVGDTHDFGEQFSLMYFDRNGTHLAGCVLTFRTMRFGIHFENRELAERVFRSLPGMAGGVLLQPFNALNAESVNVELRLSW